MYNFREKLKNNPQYAAVGAKWTDDEEQLLLSSLENKKTIDVIAREHKRTIGGIKSRLQVIAVRMIEIENKSIDEVMDILHITNDEVIQALEKERIRKEVKEIEKLSKVNNEDVCSIDKPEKQIDILKDIRSILLRIEAKLLKD